MDFFLMRISLPVVGGIIGSFATIIWTEIKTKRKVPWHMIWKYICLGAVSGFVAVNLLNPEGPFSQKMPLSILAGLSPISFLRNQSMTDGSIEDETLRNYVEEYTEIFEQPLDIPEDKDEEELVNYLKKRYNEQKGDDVNDE